MTIGQRLTRLTAALGFVTVILAAGAAQAHYCDCLWVSRYNVVIRPDQDPVTLSGGAADFSVRVQNNMGYPLVNFDLKPYASNGTVSVTGRASGAIEKTSLVRADSSDDRFFLLPGESIRYNLHISGATGSSITVEQIRFYVRFANSTTQDGQYGGNGSEPSTSSPPGTGVVVRKASGITPASPSVSDPGAGSQARHIMNAAVADFASSGAAGINALFNEYCAGTSSWADDAYSSPMTDCSASLVTSGTKNCCAETSGAPAAFDFAAHCSAGTSSGGGDKYQWQHLWAASMLAGRKNQLTSYLPAFRKRLLCGFDDDHNAFKGMAAFVVGYLGADSDAQAFFLGQSPYSTNWTTTGSAASIFMAKAAIFMLTSGSQFSSDVGTSGCLAGGNSDAYSRMVCAAALRYVNGSSADSTVDAELIARVNWGTGDNPPEYENRSGNQPEARETAHGWFAAHLLDVLAWDQRGNARLAVDSGSPTFYSVVQDTTPPKAPANIRCTTRGTATAPILRVSWDAVTQDTSNASETMGSYTLYRGSAARDAGCSAPADSACHFTNNNATSSTFFEPSGLTGGSTYFFTVRASDTAGNNSDWSAPSTFSCQAPVPARPPTAVITCTPLAATIPPNATVTCDCDDSTDPDGNATLQHCYFSLDGATEADHPAGTSASYTFSAAGSHTVRVRVADNTSPTPLTDTDQVSIVITDSSVSNVPPTAVVNPTSAACEPGATLSFDSSPGTNDADGTLTNYHWVFSDDGSVVDGASSTTADHQFDSEGIFTVALTVTDDDGATGTDFADVTVSTTVNSPPVLGDASVGPPVVRTNTDVTCDATGVWDPEVDNITVSWDFGDGSATSCDTLATHQYPTEGTYTVTLNAVDDGSPPATATPRTWPVTVSNASNLPPSCANATVTPLTGGRPLTVALDASGCTDPESTALTYRWSVRTASGVFTTYATMTASHVFDELGSHEITIAATDSGQPAMQSVAQRFAISVTGDPGAQAMVAVCGCANTSRTELAALLLAVFGLPWWRRRQR